MKKIFFLLTVAAMTAAFAKAGKAEFGGYCVVAYVDANAAVLGTDKYVSLYQGKTYYFVNQGAKDNFDKDPEKYAKTIKYKTFCATAVAYGKKVASDPSLFSNVNGHIYFFANPGAKAMFDKDQQVTIEKAEANWKKAKGNPDGLK